MTDKTEQPKPDWALTGRERKAKDGKTPRRRWPWAVLVIAAVCVGAWMMRDQTPAEPTAETTAAPAATENAARDVTMQLLPSELTEIAPRALRDTVRITGSLAPIQQLGIPAEVSGRVESVTKSEGDAVAAGDTLVQIDLETLRNQLDQSRATADATRAQLTYAEEQFTRTQSLVNRGVSSSSTLDSTQANVDQLRANLAALEKQVSTAERAMDKATITAPFAGIIADRSVDPGAYITSGTALMTLVDISSLELEGAVPVSYAPRITPGQTVEITVDGFGDQSFTGTIGRVAPVAVSGTRMLPIYADIDNPDTMLRGGMFASGQLVLNAVEDAIGVPADAVREDDDGTYVLKIEGETVQRQGVTVGSMWDRGRTAQITEGLSDGDVIVSSPMARLQPGMSITVIGE